jgi:hypothetical protein
MAGYIRYGQDAFGDRAFLAPQFLAHIKELYGWQIQAGS